MSRRAPAADRARAWVAKNGGYFGADPRQRQMIIDLLADEFFLIRSEALRDAQAAVRDLEVE